MRIVRLAQLTHEERTKIMLRSDIVLDSVADTVRGIMNAVEERGDEALFGFSEQFDKAKLSTLNVTTDEIAEAYKQVSSEFITAFKQALANSQRFEEHLCLTEEPVETAPGIKVWREWRPIEKVGLYIPGGKANYPSSIAMTAVPAKIAGCKEFIVCTPPRADGSVSPYTLVACDLAGVDSIFKLGGAQAIAAMVYGTKSVPQVYKIFGAGSVFVTAAKIMAFGKVDIDMPAGPSEIMIVADKTANPRFIAADLLTQAEHGEDSSAVLITDSESFATAVQQEIKLQTPMLERKAIIEKSLEQFGAIILVDTLEEAVTLVNEYAPEHLEIVTKNDDEFLAKIVNVGSVFLGRYSTESAGDYASGSNHVLPTNGFAKMFNPLSVESFGKKIQVQRLTKEGLAGIRKTIAVLADAEGLTAHKQASEIRFENDEA